MCGVWSVEHAMRHACRAKWRWRSPKCCACYACGKHETSSRNPRFTSKCRLIRHAGGLQARLWGSSVGWLDWHPGDSLEMASFNGDTYKRTEFSWKFTSMGNCVGILHDFTHHANYSISNLGLSANGYFMGSNSDNPSELRAPYARERAFQVAEG